jgi:hypothetical protein
MAIPTTEPAVVTAGDTIAWTRSLSDYAASSGWTLKYRLINAAGKIDITASASGADHAVSVSAATSAGWTAGTYAWQAYVEKSGERYTVGTGSIVVKPNLAAQAAGFEARGTWEKALADLRAALAAWITSSGQVAEYEIAGRRMKFANADDIRKRIAIAEKEAAREAAATAAAAGNPLGRQLFVRFNNGR